MKKISSCLDWKVNNGVAVYFGPTQWLLGWLTVNNPTKQYICLRDLYISFYAAALGLVIQLSL